MNDDLGRVPSVLPTSPGSRASTEPVSAVSAASGFDPSRDTLVSSVAKAIWTTPLDGQPPGFEVRVWPPKHRGVLGEVMRQAEAAIDEVGRFQQAPRTVSNSKQVIAALIAMPAVFENQHFRAAMGMQSYPASCLLTKLKGMGWVVKVPTDGFTRHGWRRGPELPKPSDSDRSPTGGGAKQDAVHESATRRDRP